MQIYFTRWAKLSVSPPVLPILMDLLQNFTWFVTALLCRNITFGTRHSVVIDFVGREGQIALQQVRCLQWLAGFYCLVPGQTVCIYTPLLPSLFTFIYYNSSNDHFRGPGSESKYQSGLTPGCVIPTHKHHQIWSDSHISHGSPFHGAWPHVLWYPGANKYDPTSSHCSGECFMWKLRLVIGGSRSFAL